MKNIFIHGIRSTMVNTKFAAFLILPLFLMVEPWVSAETKTSYVELLKQTDDLVNFSRTDLSAEYFIEKRDPGGSISDTRATMFRRDRSNQFLILILEPSIDKGKGYLKIGDNLWLYDPVGKTFTFTSAKERFQNSSARNSDFSKSNLAGDYKPISGRKEKLGKFDCVVLDLVATNDKVSFPKRKVWISEDKLVRKIEDYSLSDQLMRITAIPTYQKLEDKWVPSYMVIEDHLRFQNINGKIEYERTSIRITSPSLEPLPDTVYTKEYLERVAR